MSKTKIPWATDVWNPTVGCTKLSAGCKNCYAERIFNRFHRWPRFPPYEKFSEVRCYPEKLGQPLHWKRPRRVFVDSMSDLCHEDVSSLFIDKVFETMHLAWWHTFLILTKRAERMWDYISRRYIPNQLAVLPNVWLGVSIEDQPTADNRITWLLKTPAAVRFVSVEPMLGPIDLLKWIDFCPLDQERPDPYNSHWRMAGDRWQHYHGYPLGHEDTIKKPAFDWVICGCESGPGARPMDLDWVRFLRNQCQAAAVPFFLKQAVINGKLVKMPALDGVIWEQYPKIDNNYAENQ